MYDNESIPPKASTLLKKSLRKGSGNVALLGWAADALAANVVFCCSSERKKF